MKASSSVLYDRPCNNLSELRNCSNEYQQFLLSFAVNDGGLNGLTTKARTRTRITAVAETEAGTEAEAEIHCT